MMTSEDEIVKLRVALAEAVDEIDALKARLDGDVPQALRWLQRKAERQRHALDGLNRTVLSLHFALRLTRRGASASTLLLRRSHNQTGQGREGPGRHAPGAR